jgi:DNA-binding response OmpR family regulator
VTARTDRAVLIIDDDPQVRTLLGRALTAEGLEVHGASDGLEGLALIAQLNPACLIVDVQMPKLDGYRLVRALKAKPDTAHIPVIFVTAASDPHDVVEGINSGARFYITKPFDLGDVVAKVKRILEGSRA